MVKIKDLERTQGHDAALAAMLRVLRLAHVSL
jgi:hypothetical protein